MYANLSYVQSFNIDYLVTTFNTFRQWLYFFSEILYNDDNTIVITTNYT